MITTSLAVRESRPTAVDSRIRVLTYSPDDVIKFTGYYGYQTSIEFAPDESIESISMGVSTGWQMVPSGNKLFLKPVDEDATTNMTLITNKRTYFFELFADEAKDIRDPNLVFNVRFLYPEDTEEGDIKSYSTSSESEIAKNDDLNFEYTISGSEDIAPIKIFDDGKFTYFEFKHKNTEIPAIYSVSSDLREYLVNYHQTGKYIVVEKIYKKFALRLGADIVCVFNENY
jgi:type IV secretion system protein VirB9